MLLNPGGADFLDPNLKDKLDSLSEAKGQIKTDPTMDQLIKLVERIYKDKEKIYGKFHIYNLFNLQNTTAKKAIDEFEALVNKDEYNINETLVSMEELKSHPWMLLGWGVEYKAGWKNLKTIKGKWKELIGSSEIHAFGKKHNKLGDYYHPCPRVGKQAMLEELISLYEKTRT